MVFKIRNLTIIKGKTFQQVVGANLKWIENITPIKIKSFNIIM